MEINNINNTRQIIKRQVAIITNIETIQSGQFIKKEGWEPSYILTNNDEEISRVNLVGVIVAKQQFDEDNASFQNLLLDDGSSKINLRSFDVNKKFDVNIGDIILVIGRPREFAFEKYVVIETVKKINKAWLKIRELQLKIKYFKKEKKVKNGKDEMSIEEEKVIEENKETPENLEVKDMKDIDKNKDEKTETEDKEDKIEYKILDIVKELDKGNGADVQEIINVLKQKGIISEANLQIMEGVVENMLKLGEIFEIKPGRVKIL